MGTYNIECYVHMYGHFKRTLLFQLLPFKLMFKHDIISRHHKAPVTAFWTIYQIDSFAAMAILLVAKNYLCCTKDHTKLCYTYVYIYITNHGVRESECNNTCIIARIKY